MQENILFLLLTSENKMFVKQKVLFDRLVGSWEYKLMYKPGLLVEIFLYRYELSPKYIPVNKIEYLKLY